MNEPPAERTGMLVIRLWDSAAEDAPLVGRVSRTSDVVNVPQTVMTFRGIGEIGGIAGERLEEVTHPGRHRSA